MRLDIVLDSADVTLTHGVWDGVTENVAIYTVELATDVQAQRIAFALAVLTGNVAVLFVRDTDSDDYSQAFGSTAHLRVTAARTVTGDRILYPASRPLATHPGYAYAPSLSGFEVAFTPGVDGTLAPVG